MDIEGAIFDVDGTLLDSMGYWEHLGDEYLLSRQLQPPENLANLLASMTLLEAAKYFKDRYGIQDEAEEMIKDFEKLMEGHYQVDIPENLHPYFHIPNHKKESRTITEMLGNCPAFSIRIT